MGTDVVTTAVQAVVGGALVVAFALLGHALEPKRLAGIFSAAPSIALAGLLVTVASVGDRPAARAATGMLLGAAGFVAFSVLTRPLLARVGAVASSLLGCCAWVVVAVGGYELAFR